MINPPEKIEEWIKKYSDYAKNSGFQLNPKRVVAEGIVDGLLEKEKKYGKMYCPCRRVTGDVEADSKIICPCAYHKEEIRKDGHCLCGLFVKQ